MNDNDLNDSTLGPVRGRFLLGNETEAINYNKIVINTNIWILTIINYICIGKD